MAEALAVPPVRERPILFAGRLVRAILDGRKTQTRRLIRPAPPSVEAVRAKCGAGFSIFTDHYAEPDEFRVGGPVWAVRELMGREPHWRCPFGSPGGRLWVRETWARLDDPTATFLFGGPAKLVYREELDAAGKQLPPEFKWKPSIHMRREFSRITLEVTSVRVERLQDISEADAQAEGVEPILVPPDGGGAPFTEGFMEGWDSINGKRASWSSNPWVWVIEFRRVK